MSRNYCALGLTILLPTSFAEETPLLEETVVTATTLKEPKTKGSTSSIDSATLLKRGSVTLPDALQREPGVSIPLDMAGIDPLVPYLQGGSKGINIRGMEGNRVEILVDGIPQPDDYVTRTFQGTGGPGRIYFDPATLSNLDLFKSAQPGSGALAGTVSGQTESPLTLLGSELVGSAFHSTTNYASSNRSLNERLAMAWGNGHQATSLVYSYRNGHELKNNGPIEANPATNQSHAVVWKTVFRNDSWTFTPTIDYFRSDSKTELNSNEGLSIIGETLNSNNDSQRERFRASLDFEFLPISSSPFADRYHGLLYFQSSYSENLNRQLAKLDTGGLRNTQSFLSYDTDIFGLNLGANKEIGKHALSYRYQGSRSDISGSLERTIDLRPEPDFPNLAPSIVWDHALSVVDEYSLNDRWTLTPSLRLHHYQVDPTNTADFLAQSTLPVFDEFGRLIGQRTVGAVDYENTYLSPSLHLEYQASEELNIFANYTLGFRNPTAEELGGIFVHPDNLSISLPNPDLEAEDSHAFEFGLKHETDNWSHLVSTYYNRYGNFLESNVPTGEEFDDLVVLTTRNTRNAETYGIEIKSEWTPEGPFSGGGSLAWSRGRSDDGPLNSVDPWKAVAYLAYDDPENKWGLELSGTYVAPKYSSDITGDLDSTEDYFLLDLTGYYQVNDSITIRGGLKNILDQDYVLWSRANRGSGHTGGVTSNTDTQPGINGFLSIHAEF